jgi:hypothetical protein
VRIALFAAGLAIGVPCPAINGAALDMGKSEVED